MIARPLSLTKGRGDWESYLTTGKRTDPTCILGLSRELKSSQSQFSTEKDHGK